MIDQPDYPDQYKGQKIVHRFKLEGNVSEYMVTRNPNTGKYIIYEDGKKLCEGFNVAEMREKYNIGG